MPNVAYVRDELKKLKPLYQLISDCIAGQYWIKLCKSKYLPIPNASDTSSENASRYSAYVQRAVFYNVTKRTLNGLVGFVFLRDPAIEVPAEMEYIVDDATGEGVALSQSAKEAVTNVLAYGRAGLWVDFPKTTGEITVAQRESGELRGTLTVIDPLKIINWKTEKFGGKIKLSLVVFETIRETSPDGFEIKKETEWRVLRLVPGENGKFQYQSELWRKSANNVYSISPEQSGVPTDADGNTFEEIPFQFIGVDNNNSPPDQPPLYDLAVLNIAHYCNSADYEESCFLVGQPTPWFSGLTEDWVTKVMGGVVNLGSRAAIPLPVGGEAGLLQAESNTMPKEAMEHKERQMVALGAKLVEDKQVQRTATEAGIENASETSIIASAAKNVSTAFLAALKWVARFEAADPEAIKFQVHSDLGLSKMTAEERSRLVSEWQAGAIAWEEMRDGLRQSGIATLDDAAAQTSIQKQTQDQLQLEASFNNPAAV